MSRFGVIIDAGSSGSRIYVYTWEVGSLTIREVPPVNEEDKKKAKVDGGKPDIWP
jgi:Golgi nucleoside diphosphatase